MTPSRELRIAKIQAKASVFWLIANKPITHVTPKRGLRITDALIVVLRNIEEEEGGVGVERHKLRSRRREKEESLAV